MIKLKIPKVHYSPIDGIPETVAKKILAERPRCTSVRVEECISRNGEPFLMYSGWEGSRDGFPIVTTPAP